MPKLSQQKSLIAGVLLGAGLVSGGLLIQSGAWREARANVATGTPRLLQEVMARVQSEYIDSLSVDEMYRRAASGLVKETEDPYSVLLTPERFRRLRETTTGRYAGIGVELGMRDGFVTVIAPLAGTPADSAGIAPGDHLVSANGKTTIGLSMDEVQQQLRGAVGSKVTLGLERAGAHRSVTLTRRMISYHPVQRAENMAGVGYIRLATFSEDAAAEVRRAVDSLRRSGARSLILDLRENPGGLLEEGIGVADLFLDRGATIASTRGRTTDADHEFSDGSAQQWPDLPVVALVDSGSASAAEIVAGALQDNKRAVLVGAPTYGKGSAQSIFPISQGYGLKLTTARWFTPDGRSIERDSTKGGITPDIEVGGGRREAGGGERVTNVATDSVLARALQLLSGVTTPEQLRARAPKRK